ncbi:MAG: cupin domain-containing protein [Spirochaetota bacterium]
MAKTSRKILTLVFLASVSFCKMPQRDPFTEEEKLRPFVIKEIARDASSSRHLVLMNGAEQPHYHDRHNLVVTLKSGNNRLHLGERVIDMLPGQPVEIPKGALHWAENAGPGFSLVEAVFTPPFDGKDRRFH